MPTVIESGALADYDTTTWYGVVAPAGTPPAVIARLNRALTDIAAEPAIQERMAKAGAVAKASTPEAFGKHMESELARWGKVREAAGIAQQ